MFIDRLIDSIIEKNNPTVAGLDPKFEHLPQQIRNAAIKKFGSGNEAKAYAILEFNKALIDAIYDLVAIVKPQLAYFEQYGPDGMKAFDATVKYAHEKGLLVIADGKRNDIGSTAENYAEAYLGTGLYNADAMTVNPYFGHDGIKPFADICDSAGKGIFILVKTSNPSSAEIQDLKTEDGRFVYEKVGELVDDWASAAKTGKHGYASIGAVVGATYPGQASVLRKIMKRSYFLVPGYGAQGGSAEDAAANFGPDGLGAIVNASRSLMYAYKSEKWNTTYDEEHFADAARAECKRMRDELNGAVNGKG